MKSIMMMLILASAPAMAVTMLEGYGDQPVVDYISWCDGNSVVGQDQKGDLYIRANCDEAGLQCKTSQVYRNQGSVVYASCVKK